MADGMAAMPRRVEAVEHEPAQATAEWRHEAAAAARGRVAGMSK